MHRLLEEDDRMITVWKYPLAITDRQVLNMPRDAQVLSVEADETGHAALLWALVDTDAPREDRAVLIYGTGNPAPEDTGKFIGTVRTHGRFYWHVFLETVETVDAGSIWVITTGRSEWDTEGIADVRMTVNTTLGWYPTKQDAEQHIKTLEVQQYALYAANPRRGQYDTWKFHNGTYYATTEIPACPTATAKD